MTRLLFILTVIIPVIFTAGCGPTNLSIDKISFNKLDSNGMPVIIASEPVNTRANTINMKSEAAFLRGDIVLIVMNNVREFKKGKDSLNRMELDVEIKGPDKKIIFSRNNMLGEKGHVYMPGNRAREPFASYNIPQDGQTGKYLFKIKISDLVSRKYRIVKGSFIVN